MGKPSSGERDTRGVRVTAQDIATGESDQHLAWDDYVLVAAGGCQVTNTTVHRAKDGTQTHVVTIKGIRKGAVVAEQRVSDEQLVHWAQQAVDGDAGTESARIVLLAADLRESRAREARYRENYEFQQAMAQRFLVERNALATAGQEVMDTLQQWGSGTVAHLMDTDDNAGERLRQLVRAALTGTEPTNG